jgi:hypothetical protein
VSVNMETISHVFRESKNKEVINSSFVRFFLIRNSLSLGIICGFAMEAETGILAIHGRPSQYIFI